MLPDFSFKKPTNPLSNPKTISELEEKSSDKIADVIVCLFQ